MSAAILPTLTSHPSSFVFVESLQLWPQISQTVFALIDLEGKKKGVLWSQMHDLRGTVGELIYGDLPGRS